MLIVLSLHDTLLSLFVISCARKKQLGLLSAPFGTTAGHKIKGICVMVAHRTLTAAV